VTDQVDIPRSHTTDRALLPPGHWRARDMGDGLWIVVVCCPRCERRATLHKSVGFPDRGHQVAEDGTVTPSIVCPSSDCDWHVWGRLLCWKEPPL